MYKYKVESNGLIDNGDDDESPIVTYGYTCGPKTKEFHGQGTTPFEQIERITKMVLQSLRC